MAQSLVDPLVLRPAPERAPKRPRLFRLRAALGAAAVVLGLALIARERAPEAPAQRPVRPAVLVAPPAQWQPVADAKPRFIVEAPELKALPRGFEARRRADGGREDKIVHGTFESEDAYLRLAVFWGPSETASFFIDLARRAGEAGLGVLRTGRPATVATKLGPLETAEAVLADGLERPCRVFRLRHEAGLSLHGWHCAARAEAPGPAEVACLVDRLALLPGAEDPALRAVFAPGEKRRDGCPPRSGEARRRNS
ncbi:MAG TPA: hypothetical protein VF601_13450 [Beijerinckiaceae bacterium]|jgi:hypothetical protein